jgi:prefoldin subunit 5
MQDMQPTGLAGRVETMFDQGYSEEEIKQELRGQYSDQEITNAVNQAVTDTATSATQSDGPEPMTPYEGDADSDAASPIDEGYGQDNGPAMESGQSNETNDTMQTPPPPTGSRDQSNQEQSSQQADTGMSQTEELVEAVVAENLQRVRSEFQNVYGEMDETQKTVETMAETLENMENSGEDQQTELNERINEIETQLESAQSRMDGMERAFQQVLPDLVENIRELTNLVQDLKDDSSVPRQTKTRSQGQETKDDMDEFTAFD